MTRRKWMQENQTFVVLLVRSYTVLIVSALAACGCQTDSNSTTSTPRADARDRDTAILKPVDYMPLAVGNTWSYTRTVAPKKRVFCYADEVLPLPDGKKSISFTVNAVRDLPDTSVESYSVTGKAGPTAWGEDFWNVSVDGNNPRDGRFVSFAKGRHTTLNTKVIKWGYSGKCLVEAMDGISTHTQDDRAVAFGRIMGLLEPDNHIYQERGDGEPKQWLVNAMPNKATISVPAGTFDECLECVTIVAINGAKEFAFLTHTDPADRNSFGKFTEKAYFAPHVGLVEEIQTDVNGDEVYRLELKSYSVKK